MRALAVVAVVVSGCGRTAPYGVTAAAAQMDPMACITAVDNVAVSWQRWRSPDVTCFGMTFSGHGVDGEYAFASIPPESDPGWVNESSPNISFDQKSRLCEPSVPCGCSQGGDFTYFQTHLELAREPSRVSLDIQSVDDGVEVRLFNARNPDGVVVGHAYFPGGATADFGDQVIVGSNRVVLTHVDDCCSESRIANAVLNVDGETVTHCR